MSNPDHQLYGSPFLAALEAAFLRQIQAEKETDPLAPVIVMVGSNLLGRWLLRQAARDRAIVNLRFVTIWQMTERLGRDQPPADGPLSPLAEEFLLRRAIAGRPLPFFQPVARSAGFRAALASTLRDLRDAGIDRLPPGPRQSAKRSEVAALYQDYLRSFRDRGRDDSDLLRAAAANADAFPARFGASRLHIYGLYDFNHLQGEMIRALAQVAALRVFIPCGSGPSFAYARRGKEWYLALPGMKETALPPPDAGPLLPVHAALAGEQHPPGGRDRVEILSAPGEHAEIEEIAARILTWAEAGLPFARMAVILRDRETYLPLIREVFGRAGIPFYGPGAQPRAETEAGRILSRIAALFPRDERDDFFRPRMAEFFAAPGFRPGADADEWTASRWGEIGCRAGIVSGREEWDRKLARIATDPDDADAAEADRLRAVALRLIDRLLAGRGLKSFAALGGWLDSLLREFTAHELPTALRAELLLLDRLGVEADLARFGEALGSWLDSGEEPEPEARRFQEGAVTVGSLMPLRFLRFEAVLAPGLVARSFPAPSREDPILLDREREELEGELGIGERLPRKSRRPEEDRLLFTLLVQAATERLTLTYPRTDPLGRRERLPSPYLLELASALTGERADYGSLASGHGAALRLPLSRIRAARHDPAVLAARPPLDEPELALWAAAKTRLRREPPPAWLGEVHPFLPRGIAALQARRGNRTGALYGRIEAPDLIARLHDAFDRRPYSSGALEQYAKCPFQFLCRRLLELEPPATPEDFEFSALEKGDLFHRVLHRFMSGLQRDRELPLKNQPRARLDERLQAAFRQGCAELEAEIGISGLDWEFVRDEQECELTGLLNFLLKREDESYAPIAFEQPFGAYAHDPNSRPFHLDLPDGSVIELRGRIDLIEEKADGSALRVLDYKTGRSKVTRAAQIVGGTALQRPLYLLAAADLYRREIDELAASESGYVYVLGAGERNLSGKPEVLIPALEAVAAIVGGMRSGIFSPLPSGKAAPCDYCDYQGVCLSGASALTLLDPDDPARALRERLDRFP
jgi:ATP-dependent helicase/nuclease subunit B